MSGEARQDRTDAQEAEPVMRRQSDVTSSGRPGESGFALMLAIVALMRLTFLGLTLAATTSTELQIATNYRWSQQALYNAEAGLEASKIVLSRVANTTTYWDAVVGVARSPLAAPPTPAWTGTGPLPAGQIGRDYLHAACPGDHGGAGSGHLLAEHAAHGKPYADLSNFIGHARH